MRSDGRREPAVLVHLSGGPGPHHVDVDLADNGADVTNGDHADRAAGLEASHAAARTDATTGDNCIHVAPGRAARRRRRRRRARRRGTGHDSAHKRVGVRLGQATACEQRAVMAHVVEERGNIVFREACQCLREVVTAYGRHAPAPPFVPPGNIRSSRSILLRRSSFSRSSSAALLDRNGSEAHQSMPISFAVSADAMSRRTFNVNSSMSSTLTTTSPAMTTPLSRTRSRMSASDSPGRRIIGDVEPLYVEPLCSGAGYVTVSPPPPRCGSSDAAF